MKTEFQRILRDKLRESSAPEPLSSSLSHTDGEPAFLAFLLGTLNKSAPSGRPSQAYNSTSKAPPKKSSPDINATLPQIPKPPPHLSHKQQDSWLWFWKRGAPLEETFTKADLQKQYRKLARLLHPDQNPHPKATESFVQLRHHYDTLYDF